MFLRDILAGWCKINTSETTRVIHKEIIWNNSQIKCNNKVLFYVDWFEKGIKFIEHIYDFRFRKFHTIEQLQNLYNISENDFLKYYNIVSNITKEWKNKLKDENYNNVPKETSKALHIVTKQKGSINKSLYNLQLRYETLTTIKSKEKWAKEFPNQELKWPQIYLMSFNCTIDVKLRNFNYKYLMRIIPNNKYLFKCKLAPSVLATFVQCKKKPMPICFGNVGMYRICGHKSRKF